MARTPPRGPYGEPLDNGPDEDDRHLRFFGRRLPNPSTTHILLAIIGVLVLAALVVNFAGSSSDAPNVEIVTPTEDGEWPAGEVLVRVRVDVPRLTQWQLFYRGPETEAEWSEATRGDFNVIPSMRQGLHGLFIQESGTYELRLVARDEAGVEIDDTIKFVVTP